MDVGRQTESLILEDSQCIDDAEHSGCPLPPSSLTVAVNYWTSRTVEPSDRKIREWMRDGKLNACGQSAPQIPRNR